MTEQGNKTLPTEAMRKAGFDAFCHGICKGATLTRAGVEAIYLAMQAARPAPDTALVEKVARDIEGAMICLAKRAEEIGTHPPTWKELAKDAATAALEAIGLPNIEGSDGWRGDLKRRLLLLANAHHTEADAATDAIAAFANLSARLERAEGANLEAHLLLAELIQKPSSRKFYGLVDNVLLGKLRTISLTLGDSHAKG